MNKNLKNNKELQKAVAFALAAVIVLAVAAFNVLKSLDNVEEIQYNQTEINTLNAQLDNLKEIENNKGKMEAQLITYQNLLPENLTQQDIFTLFGNVAEQHRVNLQQVSCDASQKEFGVNKIPVTISLSGQYLQIMKMLESLTKDYSITSLEDIYISANDGNISVEAAMSVYYK